MPYADVIFNLRIDKSFTYYTPSDSHFDLKVGQRVLVPLGKRELTGIIVKLKDSAPELEYKEIIDVLDKSPLLSEQMLHFTKWISDYYLASWGNTCQLALPKGLDQQSQLRVELNSDDISDITQLSARQHELYDIIVSDPGKTTRFYRRKMGSGSFYVSLRTLQDSNLIRIRKEITNPKVRKRVVRSLSVAADFEKKLAGKRNTDDIIPKLLPLAGHTIAYQDFRNKTGLTLQRIKRLISLNVLSIAETEEFRLFRQSYREKQKNILINAEQQSAIRQIHQALEKGTFQVFLLHGVTGSGKTQVYLESILAALKQNKSAIVLIPEISLTPQTVARFESFFDNQIYIFHSKMSPGERYDTWRRVQSEEQCIVVGPRSALFLPVSNIGIIVVDEEHDSSYKQESPAPRYHARDMAIYRAKMNDALVVLGSATPSMESYYHAENKKYHLLELKNRPQNIALPQVHIVDMKKMRKSSSGNGIITDQLHEKIKQCLLRSEQVIILQNRRGFSSLLQCKECGFTARCPNCDIYLTYHTTIQKLQCHYCNYQITAADRCAKCNGLQIAYSGAGTQKVEKELKRLFPTARILRMDVDTTKHRHAHERILSLFKERKADILLGTQMIAKGLDFESVSLVGVISADIGLTFPDFRSAERIFQLLTQVSGRSGRTKEGGEVIIQTNLPNHYALQFAQHHDFGGFYHTEIERRQKIGYPPFSRLIKVLIQAEDLSHAVKISGLIINRLKKYRKKYFSIIGPAPAPLSRIKNKYRWQIILKIDTAYDPTGKNTRQMLRKMMETSQLSGQRATDVYLDVDPLELL